MCVRPSGHVAPLMSFVLARFETKLRIPWCVQRNDLAFTRLPLSLIAPLTDRQFSDSCQNVLSMHNGAHVPFRLFSDFFQAHRQQPLFWLVGGDVVITFL